MLLIMTDDVGFAASSTFGGPIPTPTFDALAAKGVRYNNFNTTAMCSPTRAALLTGRNHHSVGAGALTELATGEPGYNSIIPASAATIGQVLRLNGYSTSWFGKNHNTPDWETGPSGPFDRWPTGLGFDYFYGFMGFETNQWAPALYENTRQVEPPTNDPSYILDRDLADKAIDWLHAQHANTPDKPFLLYFAPGTAHAPHHAPKEWIERFKGQFDQGWDVMREQSFARQKAAGVIPADAALTPRPAEIPAWASLSPDQKRLYARTMEVHAAALAYADAQIGRVIEELRRSGQLDNTMVIYIQGDNGACGEGGPEGASNEIAALNGIHETKEFALAQHDKLGGPEAYGIYPVGWAWAMNTPFKWTKQVASHFGGTRNGMVVSWPGHVVDAGRVRDQFAHVIDIAPTLYEAIGIKPPSTLAGTSQQPIEGTSLLYTLAQADAAGRHRTQYFEMFANRAIMKDGWMASTTPKRVPWILAPGTLSASDFEWELYQVSNDFSQARDLAAVEPAKLEELKKAFDQEARNHQVLPLNPAMLPRTPSRLRPYPLNGRSSFTYFPGPTRYPNGAFPDLKNRSWTMTARLDSSAGPGSGVLATQGGRFGGWSLFMKGGRPGFAYRASGQPADLALLIAKTPLAPGAHLVTADFTYDGGGPGRGGALVLKVDGVDVGRMRVERTLAAGFSAEGAVIGRDTGTTVVEGEMPPSLFEGLDRVDIELR